MAYTPDDLARLERALARGEMEVEHNGTRTRYRSVGELQAAIREVRAGLASQQAGGRVGLSRLTMNFTTRRE